MDLMEQVDILDDLLLRKQTEYTNVINDLGMKESELKSLTEDRDSLVDTVALDTQSSDVIKKIFDSVSSEGFAFLEQMVNQALKMVFIDENYEFKIKIGSRGSERTVEFLLNDGKSENSLSECGGGVQVLVSFVFRAYYILRTKLRKVIFMDETLVQLSPQYLEPFMTFLQLLVDKFGFDFLWISHCVALESYATKFYEIFKGKLVERK